MIYRVILQGRQGRLGRAVRVDGKGLCELAIAAEIVDGHNSGFADENPVRVSRAIFVLRNLGHEVEATPGPWPVVLRNYSNPLTGTDLSGRQAWVRIDDSGRILLSMDREFSHGSMGIDPMQFELVLEGDRS